MEYKKLCEVAQIDISGVDKKSHEDEQTVRLCNFTDVYYNYDIRSDDIDRFMVATAKDDEIERFTLKKGYVAITKDSETREDIGISTYFADDLDNTILGYHCALIRPDPEILDGGYLNAYFNTKMARTYFSNQASGSGQRYTLSVDGIGAVKIPIIPLSEQKKIASLLNLINLKIRNNNRINDNLQQQAQALFLYMFPNIFSENSTDYFDSYISFFNGKTRPQSEGEFPVYGGNGILAYSSEWNANNCVIIGRVGAYCGNTFLCRSNCWVSDNAIQAKSKRETSQIFIYYLLKNASLSTRHIGSGQPLMTQGILNSIPFTIPKYEVVSNFIKMVEPMHRLIDETDKQTRTLNYLRNWLLPMLMSGQATIID